MSQTSLQPLSAHGGVIICVDDELMILTSLREQLRQLTDSGLTIEVSTDGEDALALLDDLLDEGEEVPLFISDQIMPGLKGHEVLQRVHKRSPTTRTILLTGQADLDAVRSAVNHANLYRYMSKPWEQADLLLTSRSAVESYLSEREISRKRAELERTNEVFRRFVPEPFLRRIAVGGVTEIEVGYAEEVELTILFSDIRGFTGIAESMSCTELLSMLNSYFTALSEPIHDQGGFIDKFIGDAIMAIFDGPQHAIAAIQAAWGMQRALDKWNRSQPRPLRSGIGLHSGVVVMGTVGTESRMDSTVLGDSVNLAARLEGLTKEHGHPIIVSDQTLSLATIQSQSTSDEQKEQWRSEALGQTLVKGRTEPVDYFKLY